jgi:hypothetical protein
VPQQFGDFTASELYCPKCRRAQRVREKLLLVLPGGELYEYLCTGCGAALGQRQVSGPSLASVMAQVATPRPRRSPPPPAAKPAPFKPRWLLK